MPLIDITATEQIEIGDDTYTLKRHIGFYDETELLLAGFTLRDAQRRSEEANGETRQPDAGKAAANRRLKRIQVYLTAWSYDVPITPENIKRIPSSHAKVILDKIEELEAAPEARPFRGEPDI